MTYRQKQEQRRQLRLVANAAKHGGSITRTQVARAMAAYRPQTAGSRMDVRA